MAVTFVRNASASTWWLGSGLESSRYLRVRTTGLCRRIQFRGQSCKCLDRRIGRHDQTAGKSTMAGI